MEYANTRGTTLSLIGLHDAGICQDSNGGRHSSGPLLSRIIKSEEERPRGGRNVLHSPTVAFTGEEQEGQNQLEAWLGGPPSAPPHELGENWPLLRIDLACE
ncbi:hypothetical protein PO878_00720 [Iamia majanohamensis]|uniref:Uncharacterized protein n=1 Tax=Iamia majanohamensis TaxID=467976 RepID=A0AAE9YA75_9ACTN|nr:hypothetical protein [Iamia majanohamensis]WCO67244.1 hypothetical protein PO878_00720 [Iamia majanohamensis]